MEILKSKPTFFKIKESKQWFNEGKNVLYQIPRCLLKDF